MRSLGLPGIAAYLGRTNVLSNCSETIEKKGEREREEGSKKAL
jgi:hypothetical protein